MAAPGAARVRAQTVRLRSVDQPSGDVDRRDFLGWLALGWTAFTAASAQSAIALGRFMFPNVLFEPPSTFKIGYPEEFEIGKVDERFKASNGIWVIRSESMIYVLSTVCTHLGCTPNWLETERKFKCPCHGSGFQKDGINFEGPAPRPLERFRVKRAEDGQVEVDTSKKFQYELGQWNDPESYLVV
ncbi:MAG: ubiquinol-cytochrome c reductase iron-sulfur subunit [Planctomycetes bacterium]|nr:ubiquinol-cytochrome c reductase iron-sulfur subunit [Planctomycetota bacterium]